MLNYSSSNPPPKSRITNKRVAFPLNTPTKSQAKSSVNTLPIASMPPLTKTQISSENFKCKQNVTPELPNPTVCVSHIELVTFIKNEQDKQIFLNFWKENKFSDNCKDNILLLTTYLKEGKIENVINIKAKLLAEYKDICDMWIRSIQT